MSDTATAPVTREPSILDFKTLVRTEYHAHGYLDPWGNTHGVHVILDLVEIERTDETIHRESGYEGVSHDDEVWVDVRDRERRFQRMPNLIDYHGGTSWLTVADEGERLRYEEPKARTPYLLDGEPVGPVQIMRAAADLPHPERESLYEGPSPADLVLMGLLQTGGIDIHGLTTDHGTLAITTHEGLAALDLTPTEAAHLDRLWSGAATTRDLIAAISGPGVERWDPDPTFKGGGRWVRMEGTPESQIRFFTGRRLDERHLDLRVAR